MAASDKIKSRISTLTPRQREVVRLTSLGCTVNEIAKILDIAPSTADNHRSRAMKILGTDRAVLLARIAIKFNISSMRDKLTAAEKKRRGRRKDVWN
jgi:DNA-binding CsgD family transcriptional regulator